MGFSIHNNFSECLNNNYPVFEEKEGDTPKSRTDRKVQKMERGKIRKDLKEPDEKIGDKKVLLAALSVSVVLVGSSLYFFGKTGSDETTGVEQRVRCYSSDFARSSFDKQEKALKALLTDRSPENYLNYGSTLFENYRQYKEKDEFFYLFHPEDPFYLDKLGIDSWVTEEKIDDAQYNAKSQELLKLCILLTIGAHLRIAALTAKDKKTLRYANYQYWQFISDEAGYLEYKLKQKFDFKQCKSLNDLSDDWRKSEEYLEAAARNGHLGAQRELAIGFFDSKRNNKDQKKAKRYLSYLENKAEDNLKTKQVCAMIYGWGLYGIAKNSEKKDQYLKEIKEGIDNVVCIQTSSYNDLVSMLNRNEPKGLGKTPSYTSLKKLAKCFHKKRR